MHDENYVQRMGVDGDDAKVRAKCKRGGQRQRIRIPMLQGSNHDNDDVGEAKKGKDAHRKTESAFEGWKKCPAVHNNAPRKFWKEKEKHNE